MFAGPSTGSSSSSRICRIRADSFTLVNWLWDYWTAPGFTNQEHLAEVERMLAVPGALEATLGYYRAMFDPARADPDLAQVRQAARQPMVVPDLSPCAAPRTSGPR